MERVLDELEQIHFTMKKANQVLRDMTRGIATDRQAETHRSKMNGLILVMHDGYAMHA